MPRSSNRSPAERVTFARRVLVAGAVFELAACTALLFLLRWPMNIIVVVVAVVMIGSYNVVFWRTIQKQAVEQGRNNPSDLL